MENLIDKVKNFENVTIIYSTIFEIPIDKNGTLSTRLLHVNDFCSSDTLSYIMENKEYMFYIFEITKTFARWCKIYYDNKRTKIVEQILKKDDEGNVISKLAILQCMDVEQLQISVAKYVSDTPHCMFTDIKLNDPWTVVIIYGINELTYVNFDNYQLKSKRLEKLEKLKHA